MNSGKVKLLVSLITLALVSCQTAQLENPNQISSNINGQSVTVPPRGVTVPPRGVTVPPRGVTVPPRGVTLPPRGIIDLNEELGELNLDADDPIRPQLIRDVASNLLIDIESGKVLDEASGELKEPDQLTIPPRNLTIPPRSILKSSITIPPRGLQKSVLRFAMIDAPADFKSVFVELDKVTLVDSQGVELNVPLADDIVQPIDLLTLRDKALKLNDLTVEPTIQYKQLCLHVKKGSLEQEDGSTHDLSFESGKTCIESSFTSKDKSMDLVIIDFDALKSIEGSNEQGFQLNPFLKATVLEIPGADIKDISSLAIEPQFVTVTVGSSVKLKAMGKDSNGNTYRVQPTWQVTDNQVGTIDIQGNFNALAEGQTLVTANFNNQSAQVQLTVISEPISN